MNRQETVALLAGVVGAACTHAGTRNTGNLLCCRETWQRLQLGGGRDRRRRGSYYR